MQSFRNIPLDQILFIDIETVPQYLSHEDLPPKERELWKRKADVISKNEDTPESLYHRAGIYAEFGKVVCISAGFLNKDEFRLKSFYGHDEKEILTSFSGMLNGFFRDDNRYLCAHNGKEFDFPFLARRFLINRLTLPEVLDTAGLKPWEVRHLDTMDLWRFGDFKNYTSLELLAHLFGIEDPKGDIAGSDIHRVYWQDEDLERIRQYCQKDVLTVARIFLHYLQKPDDLIRTTVIVD